MANENESNRQHSSFESAPDRQVQRRELIDRGRDLNMEKTRPETTPERKAEIDQLLRQAQDEYVELMKDEYGRRRNEAYYRNQFVRRVNRGARHSFRHNEDDLPRVELEDDKDTSPSASANEQAQQSPRQRERSVAIRQSRERQAGIRKNIEDYIEDKADLVVIAERFRESEPPLLASSLRGGPDQAYAIQVALWKYPELAEKYIEDLQKGGTHAEEARDVIGRLASNLEDYMAHAIEREELQVEMARDSLIDEGGHRMGKVMDEFRKHPVPALLGTAALAGAIFAAYKLAPEKLKKWIGGGLAVTAGATGVAMLTNMIWRSQTDDGSDMWDWLGFKPEDVTSDSTRLDRMNELLPGLDIENDQQARDLQIMLDADAAHVYNTFNDAFNGTSETLNLSKLDDDSQISSSERASMNGKASYKALEGYFLLLTEKTARKEGRSLSGMSERQKVAEGMLIFDKTFVNPAPDSPYYGADINLHTAILMTIDRGDVRAVGPTVGLDLGGEIGMSVDQQASRSAANRALERHGMRDAVVGRVETVDGVEYITINGYPWEYEYDSSRGLHTFKDTLSGATFNVGETVGDEVDKRSLELAQNMVNQHHPLVGQIEWDADKEAYVSVLPRTFEGTEFLDLRDRERKVVVTFRPNETVPYLQVEGSHIDATTDFTEMVMAHERERVAEKAGRDLEGMLGTLPIEVLEFAQDPASSTGSQKGQVIFKWGRAKQYPGKVTYVDGKITELKLLETGNTKSPEALVAEWENIGDDVATTLVMNNPQIESAYEGLFSAYAAKSEFPESFRDGIDALVNGFTVWGEDEKYDEAVNFHRGVLYAEVKRAVVQAYRDSVAAGNLDMLNPATRSAKMEQIKKDIVEKRLKAVNRLASEIASSTVEGGDVPRVKMDSIREIQNLGMCEDYSKWLERIRAKMAEGEIDTVGIEGGATAREIQNAILLTIVEYSVPNHSDKDLFDDPEFTKWRNNLDLNIALIFSRAIHSQEGNWWIDERYNAAGFKAALAEATPPIKPWRSMEDELDGLAASTSTILSIPFLDDVEYESGLNRGPRSNHRSLRVTSAPEKEAEMDIRVYRHNLGTHVMGEARNIFTPVDDLEKSIFDDQFDDLINWRVGRAVDEFNERTAGITSPQTLKKTADDVVFELVEDRQEFIAFFADLEPEGAFSVINPMNEADPAILRDAEAALVRSAIREGNFESSWERQSEEVLAWLNSSYQNEDLVGIDVPWIRKDIMNVWMDKIDFGAPEGAKVMIKGVNPVDDVYKYDAALVKKYRQFFTDVARDMLPSTSRSLNNPGGQFRRIDEASWRESRGKLEMIPDFETWKVAFGSPSRDEVPSLDWELSEKIRNHEEMRAIVDNYMDNFNEKFGVESLSFFNADWPDYFRQHARQRLEGDVLSKVSTPDELQNALLKFNEYMYKEAEFYKYFMEADLEVNQGTRVQNISVAALTTLGFLGGGVGGAIFGGMAGTAAGPGGTVGGATGGAILGSMTGTVVGAIGGGVIELLPIPEIGFQLGAPLHSRMRKEIDKVFNANYDKPGKSPETYFNELKAVIDKKAQDALQFDAATINMGPLTAQVRGIGSGVIGVNQGNIDR